MKLSPIGNKKGAPVVTIIIWMIVGVLVLVVIAAFFAGGMAKLINNIKEIFYRPGAASKDVVIAQCESFCETESKTAFCKKIMVEGEDVAKSCEDLGVMCSGIVCDAEYT